MNLNLQLDAIREGFEKQVPPDALAVMHRATADLQNSGILDGAAGEGQTAPPFELEDSRGASVSLAGLLERGPLVMTFFRGHW